MRFKCCLFPAHIFSHLISDYSLWTSTQKSRSSQNIKTENAEDGEGREEDQESIKKSLTKVDGIHSMAISDNARGIMEDDASDQQSMQNDDIDEHESKGTSSTSLVSPPALECTSSLDDRLEFKRQIEEFMEATKVCLLQLSPVCVRLSPNDSVNQYGLSPRELIYQKLVLRVWAHSRG